MEADGARVLVAGATGVIGSAMAAELRARGAHLVLAAQNAVGDDTAEHPMTVNVLASGTSLGAVRREARPARIRVPDLRLGRLDTGSAARAVAGARVTDAPRVRTGPDGTPFLQPGAR